MKWFVKSFIVVTGESKSKIGLHSPIFTQTAITGIHGFYFISDFAISDKITFVPNFNLFSLVLRNVVLNLCIVLNNLSNERKSSEADVNCMCLIIYNEIFNIFHLWLPDVVLQIRNFIRSLFMFIYLKFPDHVLLLIIHGCIILISPTRWLILR